MLNIFYAGFGRIAAFFVLLVLAGCGSFFYESASPIAPGLRFGDVQPHAWKHKKPKDYPVHGIDVSKYQNNIKWDMVRRAGIEFAFIKATEGGDRHDSSFERNWQEAKAAGIARGAYHFYYFCRPAQEQAAWFIRHVPKDVDALPPVLDMEWNHLSPSCKLRPAPDAVRQEMRIFLSLIEQYYGKRPIIYTTIDFFDRNGLAEFKNYPFWLRSVAGHPDEKYGSHPWLFWQYTGTGIIPGIGAETDINVFAGNRSSWREWLAKN